MPLSRVTPSQYQALLADKVAAVSGLLAAFTPPLPQVFPSEPLAFRQRAEFRMWHDGDDLNYVMYRREDPKAPVIVTDFPIACESIQTLMPVLRDMLKKLHGLRHRLFQVEFLATLSGNMLVTLVYHRKLDENWHDQAQELIEVLRKDMPDLSHHRAVAEKQKIVIGADFVREALCVNGREYSYRQYEQSFTQPNARININMLEWACQLAATSQGDLLELYCGNGNFTLPLSQHYDNIIATEVSKISVRAARANLEENGINNVHVVRLSAEEVAQAMNAERPFRRLQDLPKPLTDFDLRTILVDPPRAGLDAHTLDVVGRFPTILYISCNPATLAENLQSLSKTHDIAQLALFDQFPYTQHMECGLLLQRRV